MESKREILIGLSISLTGRFSAQGRQALDGLRLWQSYVNGQDRITIGQAAPQPVRLIFYDDQSRASLARENALGLLRQDRVDALFGPYSSGLTMTVAEVAHGHSKVLWNHGGSSDEVLKRDWQHVVSTATPASDYLRDLPCWLERQAPTLRRICVVQSGAAPSPSPEPPGVHRPQPPNTLPSPVHYRPLAVRAWSRELRGFRPSALALAG